MIAPVARRLSVVVALLVSVTGCEKKVALPKYYPIAEFALTERSGQPFRSAELSGKVWVANFFFASCPGICSILTGRVAALHQKFAGEDGLRFVSITTDPVADTPPVLQKYAAQYGADQRWLFLTGEKEPIWQLSRDQFKLAVLDSPQEKEPITHATRLVLVDRAGFVRGYYDGVGDGDISKIEKDIQRLLAEQ